MTATQAVLLLGTITLAGCGAGLVLIHDSNPLLKGLNWMGWALALGGVAAVLLLASESWPSLHSLADLVTLVAFVCCYRADRYLLGLAAKRSSLTIALLSGQSATALLQWAHVIALRGGIVTGSLLIALQLGNTAHLIRRNSGSKARLATQYTVGIMYFLSFSLLMRACAGTMGLLTASRWAEDLNLLTYAVFVSVAVALGFAFFWRTTAKLSLELEHMASTDPLTRVFNRRVFLDWCENEQSRSRRLDSTFSVLMLDFDHFKRINDTFGHTVGDHVLCAAVERIQDSIRGIDVLCRWGGEEFTVLLPNASEEATLIVAERVRRNVRLIKTSDPRLADEAFASLELTASIGTATWDGADDTHQRMLERADAALYEAKRSGRNRVVRSSRTAAAVEFSTAGFALEAQ